VGDKSSIEWTDASWNPIRGCSRVSEGCRFCYAERVAARFSGPGQPYEGLASSKTVTRPAGGGVRTTFHEPRWTGEVRFIPEALDLPLRWTKPRRIFVNSMSDLFHEKVEDEWIERIFVVMARAPQHTFQILTKRPERMRRWFQEPTEDGSFALDMTKQTWPLPNVWLGVSAEDQATADERIPLLLQTPAAVRWVSYEPALGPVDFLSQWHDWLAGWATETEADKRDGTLCPVQVRTEKLDWLVVGGESGPGARPFDLAWARSAIAQCRAAGVPVFVKQLGSQPRGICDWKHHDEMPAKWLDEDGVLPSVSGKPAHDLCHSVDDAFSPCRLDLRDRKGGDWAEWPIDLMVREYPR